MSRKSKSKDQIKPLNIPFTLTQGDLVQEALAVVKYQPQALNILIKVPLGGGKYKGSYRCLILFLTNILLKVQYFPS